MQCAATALQDVPVENLPKLFPDIWKIIENRSEYFESPVDFLYQVGIVVNGEIPALRPDLIGEYFVYDWLFRNSEKTIQNFIFAIWKASVSTGIFFQRLLTDFHNSLNTFPERWNILFPDNIHLSKNALIVYVLLVVTATFYCNRVNEHMDSAIITADYANGLVLLITRQDLKDAERTIVRLEKLYNKHTDSGEIAVDFAKSLFILSRKQDKQNAKRTIACLEKLCNKQTDSIKIATTFVSYLVYLSHKQDTDVI